MDKTYQDCSPNALFTKNQHLAKTTLYRLLGQPHSVALSNSLEYDDLLQYAYMGLWRACITYKKEHSSFESYAINHIRWAVMNGLNRSKLFKFDVNNMPDEKDIFDLVSFDTSITNEDSEGDLTYHDLVSNNYDIDTDIYSKLVLKELKKKLTEREKQILKLKSLHKTDKEIAKIFGVTPQNINKIIKNIQKRFKNSKEEVFY